MLTAITRAVSPAFVHCQLSFIARQPINLQIAEAQHRAYEKLLESLGARLISLPAEPELPDSMFVEDPAIVLDELAIIMPLGTDSRRGEAASLGRALEPFRKLQHIELPGTMEGGDILRVGRKIYAGLSRRTNEEGVRQLRALLRQYDYEVIAVPVSGCLHLKSAVTSVGENILLANRSWFDPSPFAGYQWIEVAEDERHAANALAIAGKVLFPASFPHTRARLEAAGLDVLSIDISELQKAESGLTCSSLLFEAPEAGPLT
jgi:dimethylargininase